MPFETVKDPHPLSFRGGRFVLFDGQTAPAELDPAAARAGARPDRRRRLAARRDVRSVRGPGRSPRGARLVDVRRIHGFRAGGAVCQGLDSPAPDRPAARGGDRGGRRLDAGFARFRTRIARPSASGPTSMSRCPRTTIASRRREARWAVLHAFREHVCLRASPVGPRRPEAARHAVARAFPSRLPRAGS